MARKSLALGCAFFWLAAIAHPASGALSLLIPQSTAFSYLGHSCGGIQEQAFATGFDTATGYPTGDVYVQTRCGGSGRGGGYHTTTYSAWIGVTWDFAGGVRSSARLAAAPVVSPTFSATDVNGDQLYNVLNAVNVAPSSCSVGNTTYCFYRAYLTVAPPGAPSSVTAAQVGDEFQVSWAANLANPATITSSTLTATPIGSTAATVASTEMGQATTGFVGPLQPSTTYQITVVSTNAGGSSPASVPITLTTQPDRSVPAHDQRQRRRRQLYPERRGIDADRELLGERHPRLVGEGTRAQCGGLGTLVGRVRARRRVDRPTAERGRSRPRRRGRGGMRVAVFR